MTTTDNNAQTWKDLADQLTPEQIENFAAAAHRTPEDLLEAARHWAGQNMLQHTMADVAAPAGTTKTSPWYHDGEITNRAISAGCWDIGNVTAEISGEQTADGAATWHIEVRESDSFGEITAKQARELALVLLDAADKLDVLTGVTPPFM